MVKSTRAKISYLILILPKFKLCYISVKINAVNLYEEIIVPGMVAHIFVLERPEQADLLSLRPS